MLKIKCNQFVNSNEIKGNIIFEMLYEVICTSYQDAEKSILEIEDFSIPEKWIPYKYIYQKHFVNVDETENITSESFTYILYWKDEDGYSRPQTIKFLVKEN